MEKYSKRYISMKETNPDIAERMPDNAETALYNTLFTLLNVKIFGLKSKKPTLKSFSMKNNIENHSRALTSTQNGLHHN